MNFYVINETNKKAKVIYSTCVSPVISKTTFDEYGVLSTPQFVTKLIIDGKECYSDSKEVFDKALKNNEIEVKIVETKLFNKKTLKIK